jgi:mono/diheme cytochrome c family protein
MEQELPLSSELSGASKFIEGWRLFKEYSCIGCHKIGGHKRPERIGPVLTSIGSKVRKDWLVKWLKNPKDYLPKAKMPRFNLSDEESGYIADYLLSNGDVIPAKVGIQRKTLDSPVKPENDVTKPSAKQKKEGEILITSLGCLGCHTINNKGNDFAPAFTDIGNKVKPDWLYRFLKKPKAYDSKTIIPDFMLPDKEIPSIVTYLMSLKKDNPPLIPPLDKGGDRGVMHLSKRRSGGVKRDEGRFYENIEKGKKLVKDLGCSGCHEIEEFPSGYDAPPLDGIGSKRVDELTFGNLSNVEKTLINWLLIKVADPKRFATDKIVTRMPYYDFSKEQIEALVTFLLSIRNNSLPPKYMKTLIDPEKTEMRGKNIIEKYNCLGCHKINNSGRDIAPDLTNEGRKSRPEWLFNFLKNPYKIRPLPVLKARMPNFNLSEKEIDTIIKYLTSVSGESYPYSFEPKKEIYSEDIWNGEKLYQEIFACGGCHVVNGQGGEVGPEHTDLASRLKREWIEQWLKNPQAIQPDVRMPRFTFKDWEFEALTNYLMSLGRYRFVQVKHRD